ncbi:hypothetical protein TEQG_03409 [Trichophyton equinum CBS 127.97]|uniref:Uncharacterized protein n=1 Tax=Trichophyton equinum (strain ATCC MYA-4606 / CBS 127.97) TaxID=559882 RepID=F2PRM0_TRIEC|nr:hypothetical protein TEQG_03409 [Trichophyton equinum CBS 127.97]
MEGNTSYTILASPAPSILMRDGYHTTTNAFHPTYYRGKKESWDLASEVWDAIDEIKNNSPLSYTLRGIPENPYSLGREHYLCGDEQSICGRFVQNVCSESREKEHSKVPDFVAVHCTAKDLKGLKELDRNEYPYLKFIGEAKTPWNHDLGKIYENFVAGKKTKINSALGQISKYMYQHKIRYGFLTTYNETIFLKQKLFKDSTWGLLVSTPVSSDIEANRKTGAVSLRQCLYYLMCVTEDPKNRIADNTTPLEQWVDDTAPKDQPQPQPHTPVKEKYHTPAEILANLSRSPAFRNEPPFTTDRIKLYYDPALRIQAELMSQDQSHRSKDGESSRFRPSPSPSARLREQEYGSSTPSKHRKEGTFSLKERMQNPGLLDYTKASYDSYSSSYLDTTTRPSSQSQGYGYPVGQYQHSARDASVMRETSPTPYARLPEESSPHRGLSQTREMILPHRPPPSGHHQSLSREVSQPHAMNPPHYPSMGPGQGGSPDRRAERHDSGSRDKGKGKAKERLDSTGGYNLRSRSDKGESSKGRGKDKDDDEKRGRFTGTFSRKR